MPHKFHIYLIIPKGTDVHIHKIIIEHLCKTVLANLYVGYVKRRSILTEYKKTKYSEDSGFHTSGIQMITGLSNLDSVIFIVNF